MTLIIFSYLFLSFVYRIEAQVPFESPAPPNSINTNVYCGYHTDCTIDCREAAARSYRNVPCAGARIEGTDAQILTVICSDDADSGCKGASITCPFDERSNDNTKCNVICVNSNEKAANKSGACEDVHISVYTNRNLGSLHVGCNGTDSCKRMSVSCPSDGAHKCNIDCSTYDDEYGDSEGACADMKVSPVSYITKDNWLDLECDEGECDGMEFVCYDYWHSGSLSKTVSNFDYNGGDYGCEDDACCPFISSNDTDAVLKSGFKEDDKGGNMMVPFIVVSVLLGVMCLISVFLLFSLQKQKTQNNVDVGFVELKQEA